MDKREMSDATPDYTDTLQPPLNTNADHWAWFLSERSAAYAAVQICELLERIELSKRSLRENLVDAMAERDALRAERDLFSKQARTWESRASEAEAKAYKATCAQLSAEAELAEAREKIERLTMAVERAERMFRWYGDLHAAKEQTPDNAAKTKRNYDEADAMLAALAKEQPR